MNNPKIFFSIPALFFLLLRTLSAQQIDYKGFPQWSWHKIGLTEYYLYTPDKIDSAKKFPVAIFLHGCCGEDDHATLRNAVDPPVRMWHGFGSNSQLEPTFIIAPKTTRGWSQKFTDIKKAVDELLESGAADPQRIYMTGFSMGGAGTWQFIEQYPGYIAAAIPMGTGIRADIAAVKNTPVWTVRGELDYFAQKLDSQVAVMRKLNGDSSGGEDWETGVNPMFTSFEGKDHGIQWDAVSELDLLNWAYSKINDGNLYPNIFFKFPLNKQVFKAGEKVELSIEANDPDGEIALIQVKSSSKVLGSFTRFPVRITIRVMEGDNIIEAIATDNMGKKSTTSIMIRSNVLPQITTTGLPDGRTGELYEKELFAWGNQPIYFEISGRSALPAGLRLENNRNIKGIPEKPGDYEINIIAVDEDGERSEKSFRFTIKEKDPDQVLVTNIHSVSDTLINYASKMIIGELPNTQAGDEVSFSEVGKYNGLTYISTSNDQSNIEGDQILSFYVDEPTTLYIGYEKLDNLFQSSIPEWLSEYEHINGGQIVAQYHYFDIFTRDFPRGLITLPGAASAKNNVIRNYFVMVKKQDTERITIPAITVNSLSPVYPGRFYQEKLTATEGAGLYSWHIRKGVLPEGLRLSKDGLLSGYPLKMNACEFDIEVMDENGSKDMMFVSFKKNKNGMGIFSLED